MKTKHSMLRRGFAMFLVLSMCLSMLQLTALAADENVRTGTANHTHHAEGWICTPYCSLQEHTHTLACYSMLQNEEQARIPVYLPDDVEVKDGESTEVDDLGNAYEPPEFIVHPDGDGEDNGDIVQPAEGEDDFGGFAGDSGFLVGDDDASVGDDDASVGDDDASVGDDDASVGDDDASVGDDDASVGDDGTPSGDGGENNEPAPQVEVDDQNPPLSEEPEPQCGMEEHTHSDACADLPGGGWFCVPDTNITINVPSNHAVSGSVDLLEGVTTTPAFCGNWKVQVAVDSVTADGKKVELSDGQWLDVVDGVVYTVNYVAYLDTAMAASADGEAQDMPDGVLAREETTVMGGRTVEVSSFDELKNAITKAGSNPTTIKLVKPFEFDSRLSIGKDANITLTANEGVVLSRASSFTDYFLMVSGNLTLTSIVIDGQKVENSQPLVYLYSGATGSMEHGTVLQNHHGKTYGPLLIAGSFVMNDGEISNNTAKKGGGVHVYKNASFTMNGGTISGNTATDGGGGVYTQAGSTFVMNDGEITGNTAVTGKSGGGVYVAGGTFTMNDGKITSNTAGNYGGGVYVHYANQATFTMTGGEITGNSSVGNGAGVSAAGPFNASGDVKITSNTRNDEANNVFLQNSKTINLSGSLGSNARIDLSGSSKSQLIATNGTEADAEKLIDDTGKFDASCDENGEIRWINKDPASYTDPDGVFHKGTVEEMMELANKDGGTVTLRMNVSAKEQTPITISNNVTLNLAWNSLSGYAFKVESGNTLTLDNDANGFKDVNEGKITGVTGNTWAVDIQDGATFSMIGGSVTGNAHGVNAVGTLNVSGNVSIANNSYDSANNIQLAEGKCIHVKGQLGSTSNIQLKVADTVETGTVLVDGIKPENRLDANAFHINAGTRSVQYDEATGTIVIAEAAVKHDGRASFTDGAGNTTEDVLSVVWKMANENSGGTVTLLEDSNLAGAVKGLQVNENVSITLDLNGKTLDRGLNFASTSYYGYVVEVNEGAVLNLKDSKGGGKLTGGSNAYGGSGVYVKGGTLNMESGEISGNTTNSIFEGANYGVGAGVYVNGGTFNMSGGTIANNQAYMGGGVYVYNGSFNMSDGRIENNIASNGGGIYIQENATGTITGGMISGNTATCQAGNNAGVYGGGGIYVNGGGSAVNGKLYLSNVDISGNTAHDDSMFYEGGAGFSGCPTAHTEIYLTSGGAIYGNGGNMSQVFVNDGDENHTVYLSKYALGGVPYEWTDRNGDSLEDVGKNVTLSKKTLAAYSNLSEIPSGLASVFITGNVSYASGGGIGSNGDVYIGSDVGVLALTKKVDGPAPVDTFDFTVTLSGSSNGSVFVNGVPQALTEGKLNVQVPAHETVVLSGIPVNAKYEIVENTTGADGTSITVDGKAVENGKAEGTITKESQGVAEVVFTNNYKTIYEPAELEIPFTKSVTGNPSEIPAFRFKLTPADGNDVTGYQIGSDTATLDNVTIADGGKGLFNVKFVKAGDYAFTVEEIPGAASGWSYDGAVWTVNVKVTEDTETSETGTDRNFLKAEITDIAKNETTLENAEITFTNSYNPALGSLTVTKMVNGGGSEAQNKTYHFTVTGPNGYRETFTITGNGRHTLTELTPGTYTVTEDTDSAAVNGYSLSVSGNNSQTLVAAGETANVTVINTYNPPGGPGGDDDDDDDNGDDDVPPPPPETPIDPDPTPLTELPDPNDPESPEEVTILEDDVPKTYVKTWDPEEEEYVYIPEDDVPLGYVVPKTGDNASFWAAVCLTSAAGLTVLHLTKPRKEEEAE